MIVVHGDLWAGSPAAWRVVPTNRIVRHDGRAVMGAGVALQAAQRFPALPHAYGRALRAGSTGLWAFEPGRILCLPTKDDWRRDAVMGLVLAGLGQLRQFAAFRPAESVRLPMLGAGLGRLSGASVRAAIERTLGDLQRDTRAKVGCPTRPGDLPRLSPRSRRHSTLTVG